MGEQGKVDATRALEQELGVLMHRLRQVMGERARLVHPDINVAGYSLLMALQQAPQRSSDLAEAFAIDKGAVSRMVSHFEELGFIERAPDPQDGRAQVLELTAHGNQRLEIVAEQRRTTFNERIADWSEDDLATLVSSIRRYNDALA